MFQLVVYKTLTGDFEDFNWLETKEFNTLEEAENYAGNVYDLEPVGEKFPGEYANSSDTLGTIEKIFK